jgi:hypothetical protein
VPTNRRRYARVRAQPIRERGPWADFCVIFLEFGPDGFGIFPDLESLKLYWEEYGEEITAEEIAKRPGTRPAPWWFWTHGKSRPIVNPFPAEEERGMREDHTIDGVLHYVIYRGRRGEHETRFAGNPAGLHSEYNMTPWQEEETAYLDRLGLLTPAERLALSLDAPAPPRGPHARRR